ncbi:hypothetical protein SADUNF_Sadunf02G0026700 [Salix dunnii]|uniref:Uncharacterized protein n=1 Tax=Salix dunnii TaxID=1413687 RepID=A0A835THK0_9ROSI|nr:hypothetical protein SADUNF_Sadunf02G0026700 [Salix dunnii]
MQYSNKLKHTNGGSEFPWSASSASWFVGKITPSNARLCFLRYMLVDFLNTSGKQAVTKSNIKKEKKRRNQQRKSSSKPSKLKPDSKLRKARSLPNKKGRRSFSKRQSEIDNEAKR